MSVVDSLTPRDTEEVKPNLFIQKTRKGWRTINPLAWKGKIRWAEQAKTIFSLSTAMRLAVVIFLVWAYLHDTAALREFQVEVTSNPVAWCNAVYESGIQSNFYPGQQADLGGLLELNES